MFSLCFISVGEKKTKNTDEEFQLCCLRPIFFLVSLLCFGPLPNEHHRLLTGKKRGKKMRTILYFKVSTFLLRHSLGAVFKSCEAAGGQWVHFLSSCPSMVCYGPQINKINKNKNSTRSHRNDTWLLFLVVLVWKECSEPATLAGGIPVQAIER